MTAHLRSCTASVANGVAKHASWCSSCCSAGAAKASRPCPHVMPGSDRVTPGCRKAFPPAGTNRPHTPMPRQGGLSYGTHTCCSQKPRLLLLLVIFCLTLTPWLMADRQLASRLTSRQVGHFQLLHHFFSCSWKVLAVRALPLLLAAASIAASGPAVCPAAGCTAACAAAGRSCASALCGGCRFAPGGQHSAGSDALSELLLRAGANHFLFSR